MKKFCIYRRAELPRKRSESHVSPSWWWNLPSRLLTGCGWCWVWPLGDETGWTHTPLASTGAECYRSHDTLSLKTCWKPRKIFGTENAPFISPLQPEASFSVCTALSSWSSSQPLPSLSSSPPSPSTLTPSYFLFLKPFIWNQMDSLAGDSRRWSAGRWQ